MISFLSLNALAIVAAVAFLYIVCTCVYRLYIHPLSKIPGPKLAALTFYYEIYFNIVQPGMFVWEIKRMHEVYGPIVRINPREIHINDLKYLDTIYSTSRPRNKDDYAVSTLDMLLSLGGTARHETHKIRRAALTPFFSKPAVARMESEVASKVEMLLALFEESRVQGSVVNLSDAYFALAQDVVKQYGFRYDEGLLQNSKKAAEARKNLNDFMFTTHFNVHFGWANAPMFALPEATINSIAPGLYEFMQFKKKVRAQVADVLADKSERKADSGERKTIFKELRDTELLPPEEKTLDRLMDEGLLLVAAGSEAVAKSLYVIHFHLLNNPSIMHRLRVELATIPREKRTWSALEKLPYLSAVIQEGNRLNFGLTMRNCRVADHDTLTYGNYTIPPRTPVSTMSLFVNTNEQYYPDPWAFRPERWIEGPGGTAAEVNERRKCMQSFGRDTRRCIGVNLAHLELHLVVAAIVEWDMELFETDESDVRFIHEYMTFQPRLGSKGVRAIVKERVVV